MPNVSGNKLIIGCPIKNDLECFKAMVKSLIESTNSYDEMIVAVGEGTDKKTNDWIDDNYGWFNRLPEEFKTSLDAYNGLFDYAKKGKADLLLIQTDVLFPKLYKRDWLRIMQEIAKDERVGAITTLNGGGISGPDYIHGMFWLGGWCTYIPYRTIEKCGKYDTDYNKFNGYGVDIDYTMKIVKAGLSIIKMNYWVDHHMMNERLHDNNPKAEEAKQGAAKFFREKWQIQQSS